MIGLNLCIVKHNCNIKTITYAGQKKGGIFIMANTKTSKTKEQGGVSMTGGTPDKVSINIDIPDTEKKRKATHKKNMDKAAQVKGDNIVQGKPINDKDFEYVCTDCLDNVAAQGYVFCIADEPLDNVGRCACGKLTTNKAILI